MNWSAPTILACVGFGFAIGGLVKPQWPLVAVGLVLVSIATFLLASGHN